MAGVSQSSAGDSWANEREFLSRPSCDRRNRLRSHDGRGCVPFVVVRPGTPGPNGPVNKRDLSTGEDGEFGVEAALCDLLARFAATLRLILRRGAKTATHVKCCGYGRSLEAVRCCQQNGDWS